ncbi:hypothetical protein [Nocardiopsis sp. MG754419]|uniref:hypothetical protein n=1 Tax=Nocardiopsis sp. MG754419 TaxID=2259865 RepID=UPI001BA5C100|nr:hypothetical protein [Nocardiopsis sp. MG754419]MBR8744830.1 hypothetical protein [Nocardiopsis sp. MG754419]
MTPPAPATPPAPEPERSVVSPWSRPPEPPAEHGAAAPARSPEARPGPQAVAAPPGAAEPFPSSTFDPTPLARGVEAWTDAVEQTPPMVGGFEERIVNVRAVPTSLVGRALFRVSFGRIKVG